MNKLLERPNFVSFLMLGIVVLVAGGYGYLTWTQRPEADSFAVDSDYPFPFDLSQPDRIVDLPKDLAEISGLSFWRAPDLLLAVQDEDGEIFVIDPANGDITESFSFGKDRDYEGISRVDSSIYVLETDGDIHAFNYREGQDEYDADKMETSFSYRNDTEGLCYDPVTGMLLITPKEQELNPSSDQARRGIYSFDLETSNLFPQPSFYVDEYELGQTIYQKTSRYAIKPSGVAIDPLTNDIYLIASVGKILIVLDRESEVKHLELLDEDLYPQPEGITFNDSGDLFLSSEGRGGDAVLVTYRRTDPATKGAAKDE